MRDTSWRHPAYSSVSLTPHGRSVAKDVRIAAHESAHAIARWSNGSSINGITVEPEQLAGRRTNGRIWGDRADLENDSDYFNRIVELVAGCVGEAVYLGESRGLRGSDRDKAQRYATTLCDSDVAAQLVIRAAHVEAEHLLKTHHHVLDRLVTVLLEKRLMDGAEVNALIARHI